jgi:hypothetical protein
MLWKDVLLHFSAQLYHVQRSGLAEKGCQPLRKRNSPPQQKRDGRNEKAGWHLQRKKAESQRREEKDFRN